MILRARLGSKPPASIATSRAKPTSRPRSPNGIGGHKGLAGRSCEPQRRSGRKPARVSQHVPDVARKLKSPLPRKLPRRRIRRSSGTGKEGGPDLRRYQYSLASRAFDRSRLSCVRGERRACACSFRCECRSSASCKKPFGHLALRLDDQELSRSRASSSLIRIAKYLAPAHPRAQDRFDTAIGALLTSSPENMQS